MATVVAAINLRCPIEGCNHFLVKDFKGDQVQVKCTNSGYTIRVFRENGAAKSIDFSSRP